MSQNYGALRIVRVRPPADATTDLQRKYARGWVPEERLVHLLTRSETTIGRALNNDIFLMDPTVSREHARLVVDEHGWRIFNLTTQNTVRVNGRPVPCGGSLPIKPQDFLVLGSTMLQLVAPQPDAPSDDPEAPTQHLSLLYHGIPPTTPYLPSAAPEPSGDGQYDGTTRLKEQSQSPKAADGQSSQQTPTSSTTADSPVASSLPAQYDPAMVEELPWEDGEENLLGMGVTMQFVLPQRMGIRTRWLIGGIGIAIVAVSVIITIIVNSLIGISAFTQNGFSSIIAALTVPLIPALAIVLLVNFIDRFEREPWFLRLAAFLWGAIIAVPPARIIEQYVSSLVPSWLSDPGTVLGSIFLGLNAGIPEEAVKGLGLVLLFLFLRDEFDNVTDGIVYGALIGAGFAMVENFDYFARNSKEFFWFLIVGRVVLGWLSHSTFTVCFGVSLGYIRHTRVRWRKIVIPLIGFLVAVLLHSVFDFVDFFANALVNADPTNSTAVTISLIAIIGDYIPPFIAQIVLLYFLIKSLAHEAAVIREFLAPEVSNGVVKVDEYALLQNSFQRTREERCVLRRSGFKQWMRVKTLYQTEIGLAFRKWHVSMGDKPKQADMQPEDVYRQRIKRLRQEIMIAEARKNE